MKIIRKLFFVVLFILPTWGIIFAYNRLTDGFNMHQIESSLPQHPQFDITALSKEEKEKIEKILQQPFHYIAKGCQFYAFESEDGKTVIKFLKQKHLRPFVWLKKIPAPKTLSSLFETKIQRRKERVENLFSSCKLAYEELKEESGLILIHLNRTPLFGKNMTLVDKLGLKHTFLIDEYEFVLQKKAVSVQQIFEKIDPKEVPSKVYKLVDLVTSRCQKGIRDRDRSFVQNVAFCEDGESAVFVDIGQFYKDDAVSSEEEQKKDLQRRLSNLLDWTQRKFPHFVPIMETAIREIILPAE